MSKFRIWLIKKLGGTVVKIPPTTIVKTSKNIVTLKASYRDEWNINENEIKKILSLKYAEGISEFITITKEEKEHYVEYTGVLDIVKW